MDPLQFFHHLYINNNASRTLFLLHGTGGDEHDLIPLVQNLKHRFNFLSLRGNVVEQGMARFFARSSPGVFDQESISQESAKLSRYVNAWYRANPKSSNHPVFLGYSNGANMILATLFKYPDLIKTAVLLHPMLPFTPGDLILSSHHFLITYGNNDVLIPQTLSRKVIKTLKQRHAQVQVFSHSGGHEISFAEVNAIETFLGQ